MLSPLPCVISQGVAPAQGRQDHTISPSASCHSSDSTTRPSHPAAYVRDDREAPLMWQRDGRKHRSDLPDGASEKIVTIWHDGQFAHGGNAKTLSVVIPGRCHRVRAKRGPLTGSASSPESRDSGFASSRRPGMTRGESLCMSAMRKLPVVPICRRPLTLRRRANQNDASARLAAT